MKKLSLLLIAGTMAMSASAQERRASVVFNHAGTQVAATNKVQQPAGSLKKTNVNHSTARTTGTGGGRWYNYVDSVLSLSSSVSQVTVIGGFTMWKDSTATFGYTSAGTPGYYQNVWTSFGLGLDPFAAAWGDSTTFPAQVNITTTDAYTVDSVALFGAYMRNTTPGAKAAVTDILRLRLVYGDGTSTCAMPSGGIIQTSYVGFDTTFFINMDYDSVGIGAAAGTTGIPAPVNYDIALTAADTSSNFGRSFPVNLAVPAGNIAGMSMSFITGDATYPALGDTVQYADGTMKYNAFFPAIASVGDGSTISFPPYHNVSQDATSGYFKQGTVAGGGDANGWTGQYLPNWAWTSSNPAAGSPSAFQYPYVFFHVSCATCNLTSGNGGSSHVGVANVKNITSVSVTPNPANTTVTINFALATRSQVTVTLTDMLGQVVASQNVASIGNGKAEINTSNLAAGVYFYTVTANGERATGRVVVAH